MTLPRFEEELGRALYPQDTAFPHAILARVAGTYDETLKLSGPTPHSVLWHTRRSQRSRFRVLLDVLGQDARRPGLVINDLGCGYGAFFDYIRRKAFLRQGRYYGYDVSPAMVAEAARRITDPRATFCAAPEATQEADYSFASGTFGLRMETPVDEWRGYVQESLRRLAAKSRRGLAFNLLDGRRWHAPGTLYFDDPWRYMRFCHRELGGTATLLDSYLPHDFTILVRF